MIRETRHIVAKGGLGSVRGTRLHATRRLCAPHEMAEAAKLNEDRGAAIIDINMGCPVKKIVNGDAGSALDARPAARRVAH